MERGSTSAPAAAVHCVDDGLLHRLVARVRPQAPPHGCAGWLRAGSSGGLRHSELKIHLKHSLM